MKDFAGRNAWKLPEVREQVRMRWNVAPLLPPHLDAEAPEWLLSKFARAVFAEY